MLIDVAIPGDRNVIRKGAEKILKYKDLTIEIKRTWDVKTRVILVINWSDWNYFKIIQKIRETVPGNHEVKEPQKTAILDTAHILRRVLMEKYIRANTGTSDMGTINSSDRMAATLFSLGTWFVTGIYV
jgi:hypothetical protein